MLSTLQGAEAVRAVLEATPETPSPVICIVENKIIRKSLVKAVELTQEVPKAIQTHNFARAMELRDAEFAEYYQCFNITTAAEQPELLLPQDKVSRSET